MKKASNPPVYGEIKKLFQGEKEKVSATPFPFSV